MRRRIAAVVGVGLVAGAAGCMTIQDPLAELPRYPAGRAQTKVLDVQFVRQETRARMTNTTAGSLGPGVLWINGWYGMELEELRSGETLEVRLSDFRDRYGAAFRAGGFFASERPDTLVLAQIEQGESLIGLIVVNERGSN